MQFSEKEFSEIVQVFESEIQDNISNINNLLLLLEKNNNDFYAVQELFREVHSIKGAARMVGFKDIQNLAHAFENVMTKKKNGEIEITPAVVDLLFNAVDYMEITIEEIIKTKGQYQSKELENIIEKLNSLAKNPPKKTEKDIDVIHFEDSLTLEKKEDENIDDLMDGLFGIQDGIERLQKTYDKLKRIPKDAAPQLYENLEALLEKIFQVNYHADDDLIKEIQKTYRIIRDISKGKEIQYDDVLLLEKRLIILHEIVGVSKPENFDDIIAALSENVATKTLRVDVSKLDRLVKQVGELVVAKVKNQNHLKEIEKISEALQDVQKQWSKNKYQIGRKTKDYEKMYKQLNSAADDTMYIVSELVEQVNDLHKLVQDDDTKLSLIVGDLENIIKGIRMLPFATIFHMFPRMIKDIATEQGKEAELLILGSEITADKKIIDELKVPLIHILRNAVDHGIEHPMERKEKGKSPVGKITLKVKYEKNNIIIEVSDDGRGLDIDQIKKTVVEKNLLSPTELDVMTQNQILNIIFWGGFSTQEEITDISGRGVGLDAVHNKISQLNGSVFVKSEFGKKFVITLKIPVAMSTVNALILDIEGQKFALETRNVAHVKKINVSKIFLKEGRKNIVVEGKTIPVFDFAAVLDMPENEIKENSKITLIVLREDDKEVGFLINDNVSEQEILRKSLAAPLMQIKNLSGLTTLSSGEICLILNSQELVNTALNAKQLSLLPKYMSDLFNPADYNVLVVEDSHTTRTLQRNILLNAGYNVETAQSGEIALSKIQKKRYEVVISDIEMPGISGFELFETINKQIENGESVKKIIISFLDSEEVKNQAKYLNVDAFMSKSTFSQEEFLNKIKKVLGE